MQCEVTFTSILEWSNNFTTIAHLMIPILRGQKEDSTLSGYYHNLVGMQMHTFGYTVHFTLHFLFNITWSQSLFSFLGVEGESSNRRELLSWLELLLW
jgi:hypothetical protein